MSKLQHAVTCPIPMPAPNDKSTNNVPFHYRKENMYLSNGGMKHYVSNLLTEENYLM